MPLTPTEAQRYSRHLPVIGQTGQEQLKNSAVLCVGAGGLGSPALQYLAAAGIGKLGVIDQDRVEVSNLQRQILFTEADIGQLKADCAKQRLNSQNSNIDIQAYPIRLTRDNVQQIFSGYDVIVDGSDNYESRYLINDACHILGKPLVSASIFQFQGQVSVFNLADGPCYRCLYPTPPPTELVPNCATGGVLGVLPGIIGTIQATEAIKLLLHLGEPLAGRLLTVDAIIMSFNEFTLSRDPECPLCQYNQLSGDLFMQHSPQCGLTTPQEILPKELAKWLQASLPLQLLDVREPYERAICNIGGEFLPLSEFNVAKLRLNKELPIIIYCKHGIRSLKAAKLMMEAGYRQVYSLKGGIIAWAEQIDATITIY